MIKLIKEEYKIKWNDKVKKFKTKQRVIANLIFI